MLAVTYELSEKLSQNCLKKKKRSVTVYGAVSRNPEIPAIPASPNNTATVSVSLAGSKI